MNKNYTNSDENVWKEFFKNIEENISLHKSYKQLPEIINQGLLTLLTYPSAMSVSFFILNKETFEFDFKTTVPNDVNIDPSALYDKVIETEVLGKAIDRRYPEITHHRINNEERSLMVVPLIVPSSVIGIVIIVINNQNFASDDFLQRLAIFHGYVFGCLLENNRLFKKYKKAQSLLEQKIAVRTMSLAQSKRELQTILNSVQTGIFVINIKSNEIITANPIAAEILKENQAGLIGKNSLDFFSKSNDEKHDMDTETVFFKNFESTVINSDGESVPVLRTTSHIFLGTERFRIESFIDITDRKEIELSLKQANELLELKVEERTEDLKLLVHKLKNEISVRERAEAETRKILEKEKILNELKTRFVSMVSHEFRTPLTIIRSSAQIIDKYKDKLEPRKEKEYLNRILSTVDLMTDILENVLFIGKSDSDKTSINPIPIDIVEFCITVINDINTASHSFDEIIFHNNAKKEIIVADETYLRHILLNLLSNAIKYNVDNKPVDFTLNTDKQQTIFIVEDHGIGIPEEDQEKIFEPFHRSGNVGSISGTGLGMSVVLRSVELHHGRITFSSTVNKGTTFKVSIPSINNQV